MFVSERQEDLCSWVQTGKGKSGDNVKSDEFLCEYFVGQFGNTIGFGPITADVCVGKRRKLRTVDTIYVSHWTIEDARLSVWNWIACLLAVYRTLDHWGCMSISVELDSDRSAVVLPKDCSIGSPRRVKNSELFISIKLFRTISACFPWLWCRWWWWDRDWIVCMWNVCMTIDMFEYMVHDTYCVVVDTY